jgi:hypothetical protein
MLVCRVSKHLQQQCNPPSGVAMGIFFPQTTGVNQKGKHPKDQRTLKGINSAEKKKNR